MRSSPLPQGRFKPLPPIPVMLMGMAFSLLLVISAASYLSAKPWIGLSFGYSEIEQRPEITGVYHPELIDLVQVGDVVHAISTADGELAVTLSGFESGLEPPSFATYQAHNDLLAREDAIARILKTGEVRLELQDDRSVTVGLLPGRPLIHLSAEFWLFNLFGLVAWNIGLAVFAVRPGVMAAKLLALSGLGFYIATLFNSIYLSRELALPESEFLTLSRLNHLGLALMLASLLALVSYFPQKISRISPLWVIFPAVILVQANEWHQWIQWPLHTYYLPIFVMYLTGIGLAICQWRLSRASPLDRAALKWVLLSIFIIMGLGLSIYFVPIAILGSAILPQWTMVGVASLLYIGFAFGIVRYRLFDVQHWWLSVWGWFLGGLAIVGMDLVLISVLNMQPLIAITAAVIFVGWIYFPVRQWFIRRVTQAAGTDDRQLLRQVEIMAQTTPSRDSDSQWYQLLVGQFSPAGVDFDEQPSDRVQLELQGSVLAVPMVTGEGTLRLTYRDFGSHLFASTDVDYVQSLLQISRRILAVREGENQAVREERQRIVRDLHDDVGGHLLTLLRQAPTEAYGNLTRRALQALREVMHAIDGDTQELLADHLDDWRLYLQERINDHRISFHWHQHLAEPESTISVRLAININRILSESVSNALQHAEPTSITVTVEVTSTHISITTKNDGLPPAADNQNPLRGRGLNNMLIRADELGGSFEFEVESGLAITTAMLPLTQSSY